MEYQKIRLRLEELADELEGLARNPSMRNQKEQMRNLAPKIPSDLFVIAWDIKQIARWGTTSQGI